MHLRNNTTIGSYYSINLAKKRSNITELSHQNLIVFKQNQSSDLKFTVLILQSLLGRYVLPLTILAGGSGFSPLKFYLRKQLLWPYHNLDPTPGLAY